MSPTTRIEATTTQMSPKTRIDATTTQMSPTTRIDYATTPQMTTRMDATATHISPTTRIGVAMITVAPTDAIGLCQSSASFLCTISGSQDSQHQLTWAKVNQYIILKIYFRHFKVQKRIFLQQIEANYPCPVIKLLNISK